ncbi:MAG: hypothetical protein ACYDER_11825 [Ktedonobacteraceae bacterium]
MKKQHDAEDYPVRRNARFLQHTRLQVTVCEGCLRPLQKTHHFVLYGNLCRLCWLALQAAAPESSVSENVEVFL